MATTSEIQVTEAYIGLLGRAPDPAGLAYWAAELDAAIAAGDDPAVALKKLTNDITLSDEWDSGIGANDASTEAGSEAIVTSMYDNLFDRAVTQAELDYWAPKLVSEEFTASEMAVALIEGAGTTDGDVLGYKQQAATYYVESVGDNHTTASADSAVVDVNGPVSLKTSKENTDYVATGVGETTALTAAADTVTMTAGSDTVTGTAGSGATFGATDNLTDTSSVDSDTLTITGDDDFDFGTVVKVENINVDIAKQVGGGFSVDAANATGGTIDFTVSDTVEIAGVEVTGETVLTMTNLSSDLTTHNVTSLDADLDGEAATITVDADATTVTVSSITANDTNIVLGNDTATTVNISATATGNTNDVASITGDGTVTLDVSEGGNEDVEVLTLAGASNDVTFDLAGVTTGSDMEYTTSGDYAVTLKGAAADFDEASFTVGADTALDIDTQGDLDLIGQGVFTGGIDLSVDMTTAQIDVQGGNTLSVTADQTVTDVLTLNAANDTTADSLTINVSNDTQELITANFETVTINTGTAVVDIDEIDMDDNDAAVTLVGSNDVTVSEASAVGSLTMSTRDATLSGTLTSGGTTSITGSVDVSTAAITSTNDVTLTGDSVTSTGTVAAANGDVTVTSTNDVDLDAVTATKGDIGVTGKAVSVQGTATAQNDVTIAGTGAVDVDAVTVTGSGSITISGTAVDTGGVVGDVTNTTSVTLSGSNDSVTGTIGAAINSASSITLSDGKFDASGQTLTTESVIISGDTTLLGATVAAESITITSTNDVTIDAFDELNAGEGGVLSGGSATGDIDVTIAGDSTGTMTIVTGSGNDSVTLNEDTVITVNSGTGADTITVTDLAASSVINSGEGDDTITATAAGSESIAFTLSTGAGDDTINVGESSTMTLDAGAGDEDQVNLDATFTSATFSMVNVELVDIAGDATLTANQFANENTFKLTGSSATLTVDGSAGTAAQTIDASGLTFDIGDLADLELDGGSGADTITGSDAVDVITGGGGNDTITLGSGGDTVVLATGSIDTVTDFVSGTDTLDLTGFSASTTETAINAAAAAGNSAIADETYFFITTDGTAADLTTAGTATVSDFSNETQVVAYLDEQFTAAGTTGDTVVFLINDEDSGNVYIYLHTDDGTAGILAAEVELVGILESTTAAGGDVG